MSDPAFTVGGICMLGTCQPVASIPISEMLAAVVFCAILAFGVAKALQFLARVLS